MLITERTSFIFTLPEDDERLKMFVRSERMHEFKRERLGPNTISYSKIKVLRNTEGKK